MAPSLGGTQRNKAHKTRFASKSSRRVHKEAGNVSKAVPRLASAAPAARALRLQRNKDVRNMKRAQVLAEKRSSSADGAPPRVLALVALSSHVDLELLKDGILAACSEEEDHVAASTFRHLPTKPSSRHKIRLTVIATPTKDIEAILEVAKVADIVAFATAADHEEPYIDADGKMRLSILRAQGFPSSIGFILGLTNVPAKKRTDIKKAATTALQGELLDDSKIFSTDSVSDYHQVLRHLAEHRVSQSVWRSQRPYILAQQLDYVEDPVEPDRGTLSLSGYVRGRALSVNQLVHVAAIGDFQIAKIDVMDDPFPLSARQRKSKVTDDAMLVDELHLKALTSLTPNPELQEPLIFTNVPDPLAGEQTWPTEMELAEANSTASRRSQKKLLPVGTSKYQASWYVDEVSDSEAEDDTGDGDEDVAGAAEMEMEEDDDEDGHVSEECASDSKRPPSSVWDDEDGRSEMMEDEQTAAQRDAELQRLKAARQTDEEFPDDVDTPTDVPARQRFAKYRGLKSFRTSPWDPKETLPSDYARIFAFQNFQRTQKHVLRLAEEAEQRSGSGCVTAGTFVRVHLSGVPSGPARNLLASKDTRLNVACGLLKHESKMSVVHFSIKMSDKCQSKIRSKDELTFHAGFRQFTARPIFSADNLNANKHKFERFLSAGQFLVASAYAPITFPPAPVILLKDDGQGMREMVASGHLKDVNPDRIILKKIVLSGYPQRVHKRKAVIRFMFHNPEDVRWFKPVELWTKYGRRGRIIEPVGTHGAMKCTFDGVIQQRDSACLSLYKRVYPKWPGEQIEN